MIEGYAQQEMPGDPLEPITQLRDRLSNLITRIVGAQGRSDDVSVESESNESSTTSG